MDVSAGEQHVDRRGFILGGATLALGGLALGGADQAVASDDPPAGVIVGTVAGHPSPQTVEIIEAGTSRRVTVSPSAGAAVVTTDGHARQLAAIPVGETIAAGATPQRVAATDQSGAALAAQLVAPCVLGVASDVPAQRPHSDG